MRLTPPRLLDVEQALEFIAADECVEVTPKNVRLRKVMLAAGDRAREVKRIKHDRSRTRPDSAGGDIRGLNWSAVDGWRRR